MFGKSIVLSQDTLAVPNIVRAVLETLLHKSVSIKDCTFKTSRDWCIGEGNRKFYATTFKGHFVLRGEEDSTKISAEFLQGYESGVESGRTGHIILNGKRHRFQFDDSDTARITHSFTV
jgi:hypothetical protein